MLDVANWFEARHSMLTVTVSAVSAALIIVQIYNLTKSIHGQTYQRIYELMISIDKFFIEHPGLKGHFYPDSELRPDGDVRREELFSIAEMMADYFDTVYHQRSTMPRHTFKGFLAYMRGVYRHSRVLREYLNHPERKKWYPEKFLRSLEAKD